MTAARWAEVSIRFPDGDETIGPASLALSAGERVLLLGPSGCGKSSLLLSLTRLVPDAIPAEVDGTVEIGGVPSHTRSPAEWADTVAHVFQAPERNLVGMSVEEEIAFALEQAGLGLAEIRARVAAALHEVALPPHMGARAVATLSGGEKQRVALAATLAQGGSVLLIDEPTAHLDPSAAAHVHTLLERRARRATLIVDHRLDGLIELIDRVVVMGPEGRVIVEGTPQEVFQSEGDRLDELGIWTPVGTRLAALLREEGVPLRAAPLSLPKLLQSLAPSPGAIAAVERFSSRDAAAAPSGRTVASLTEADCRPPSGPVVVRGASIAVEAGEVVALVGRNGAGKSTLGLALAGLTRLVDGERHGAPGLIALQNPDLQFVTGSVSEEITASVGEGRRDGFDTEAVLAQWGLGGLGRRHPLALSQGQKRRLALAALSVSANEGVLVLDEPTAGLDRAGADALEARIGALARAGRAIVIISHDMDLVFRQAHTVALVTDGTVAPKLPVEAFFADGARLAAGGLTEPAGALAQRWLAEAAQRTAC